MTIAIRPMVPADIDAARTLWAATEGIGLSAADGPPALANFLERNPALSFVAESGGEILGTLLCGQDGRRGYLYHLAVRPDRRPIGLGAQLVDRGLAALEAAGIEKCHAFVFRDNRVGRRFWAGMRWEERTDLVVYSRVIRTRAGSPVGTEDDSNTT
jgi:ribosomal protein S18 acetylase RimI-like enzyme